MDLFEAKEDLITQIAGLAYIPEYITLVEEKDLIECIASSPWLNDLKRRVQHYGYKYDYRAKSITRGLDLGRMPNWVVVQSSRLLESGLFSKLPDQVIVNEYEAGQGISPHIDCIPCFDKTIIATDMIRQAAG